jgi:hypothetical protein
MDFPERETFVKSAQSFLGLESDGKDGKITWSAIIKALGITSIEKPANSNLAISEKAFDLILEYEVGGGKNYYNKYLQRPTWPQGASGVTIGIGYDLGYNTATQFEKNWKGLLSESDHNALSKVLGIKGASAKKYVSGLSGINVPWDSALVVFQKNTLPRFIKDTLQAFPKADQLHPDAFGALVSIVFNRGSSTIGDSRKEMFNLKSLVLNKDYKGMAREVRSMKRLWVGRGLDGLLTRREEEAKLIENCA